jgi:hypothetical protein
LNNSTFNDVSQGCLPLPLKLFPVYQFFLAVARVLASFGVRLYSNSKFKNLRA